MKALYLTKFYKAIIFEKQKSLFNYLSTQLHVIFMLNGGPVSIKQGFYSQTTCALLWSVNKLQTAAPNNMLTIIPPESTTFNLIQLSREYSAAKLWENLNFLWLRKFQNSVSSQLAWCVFPFSSVFQNLGCKER